MQRLKTRAQFQAVLAGGTVSRTLHFALHRVAIDVPAPPVSSTGSEPEGLQTLFVVQDSWLGVLLPKRWAKRAVTRNAIKRQIYTVSQALQPSLPIAAHVVRLRSAFDRAQFPSASSEALKLAVRTELHQLFARVAQ